MTVAGQVVPYEYVVTNIGNVTLRGLALADDKTDGTPVCPVTILAPDETTTCAGLHTVTQAELDAGGSLVNVVTPPRSRGDRHRRSEPADRPEPRPDDPEDDRQWRSVPTVGGTITYSYVSPTPATSRSTPSPWPTTPRRPARLPRHRPGARPRRTTCTRQLHGDPGRPRRGLRHQPRQRSAHRPAAPVVSAHRQRDRRRDPEPRPDHRQDASTTTDVTTVGDDRRLHLSRHEHGQHHPDGAGDRGRRPRPTLPGAARRRVLAPGDDARPAPRRTRVTQADLDAGRDRSTRQRRATSGDHRVDRSTLPAAADRQTPALTLEKTVTPDDLRPRRPGRSPTPTSSPTPATSPSTPFAVTDDTTATPHRRAVASDASHPAPRSPARHLHGHPGRPRRRLRSPTTPAAGHVGRRPASRHRRRPRSTADQNPALTHRQDRRRPTTYSRRPDHHLHVSSSPTPATSRLTGPVDGPTDDRRHPVTCADADGPLAAGERAPAPPATRVTQADLDAGVGRQHATRRRPTRHDHRRRDSRHR